MKNGRTLTLYTCCAFLLMALNAHAQDAGAYRPNHVSRIDADEVRLDAIVLDQNGRSIKDLSAEDFEIFQDNRRQKILSCKYINDTHSPRSIVFVVDDLSMNYEELDRSRMAIRQFVEHAMRPDDQIVIAATSAGIGALQRFSSDKRQLLEAIQSIRWSSALANAGCGFDGCRSDDEDLANYSASRADAGIANTDPLGGWSSGNVLSIGIGAESAQISRIKRNALRAFGSQLAAVQYCIRALQDLSGRKLLFLMSSRTLFRKQDFSTARWTKETVQSTLLPHFRALADEAFRSSIAIHTLEMRPGKDQIDARPPYDRHLPYSQGTGGIVVSQKDFESQGFQTVEEVLAGYYLLSYMPPSGTFQEGNRNAFIQIRIKVRKKEYTVLYRNGFRGMPMSLQKYPSTQTSSLQQVLSSPFRFNDLKVNLTAGFARASKPTFLLTKQKQHDVSDLVQVNEKDGRYRAIGTPGFLLRTWMHLDANGLFFAINEEGERLLSLEFATYAVDLTGDIKDSQGKQYDLAMNDDEFARVQRDGIDLEVVLFVQNAGGYYVRGVVRDRISGKNASAYQYLEIPYMPDPRLLLSSIFVLNHPSDAAILMSGEIDEKKSSENPARNVAMARRSPAVRHYLPGEGFDYVSVIYNANAKENQPPQLEAQIVLLKNGTEYFRGESKSLNLNPGSSFEKILIRSSFVVPDSMDEGDYVLQLKVKDNRAKESAATAVQSIGFHVRKQAQ